MTRSLVRGERRRQPDQVRERCRRHAALVLHLALEALPRLSEAAGRHNLAQRLEGTRAAGSVRSRANR